MSERLRLVWAYDRPHLRHPFIVLALTSFVDAGLDATIVSSDRTPAEAPYGCDDAFSFSERERKYRVTVDRIKERQAAANGRARSYAKLTKKGAKKQPTASQRFVGTVGALWLKTLAPGRTIRGRLTRSFAKIRRDTLDTWLAYLRGFRRLLSIDADVMMASRPEAAIWAAAAARIRRLPFVYYPFELYGDQFARPSRLVAAAEKFILRRSADALITQNELRADVYVRERGARVAPVVVRNFKTTPWASRDDHEIGRLRASFPELRGKRIVLYEGSLIDGRWLDRLARSVLHLPADVAVVMMGREGAHWLERMAPVLEAPRASGRLLILPPVPHDELPAWVGDADLGVIIYDGAIRNNLFCAPGKLGDYISVGVPVLAPDFPTIAPLVNELGIGVCFTGSSAEEIARAIETALARPRASWAPALQRACDQLTWESQFPALLNAVRNLRRGDAGAAGRVVRDASR
jgi:glycosyltransferase involved in cell wall biosynthesis